MSTISSTFEPVIPTRIYKMAEAMSGERGSPVTLGEVLKRAMDALEKEEGLGKTG